MPSGRIVSIMKKRVSVGRKYFSRSQEVSKNNPGHLGEKGVPVNLGFSEVRNSKA